MSYYDPILDELKKAKTFESPFSDYGDQLLRTQVPTQNGGGFWRNLAMQLVPDLVGLGAGYLGRQEEQAQQDSVNAELLPLLEKQSPNDIITGLKDSGRADLAMQVLVAKREQEALAQAKKQELEDKWLYDKQKLEAELKGKKELEGIKSLRIGQNAAANRAVSLRNAQTMANATINAGLLNKATDIEFKLNDEIEKNPAVQAYNKSVANANIMSRLAQKKELSGLDMIALNKILSRTISDEAVNNADIEQIERHGGLEGYVKAKVAYIMNQANRDPSVLNPYLNIQNDMVEGRRAEAQKAIENVRAKAVKYSARNPNIIADNVGTELSANPLKDVVANLAQAKKATSEIVVNVHPRNLKVGETTSYGGKRYRKVSETQVVEE